MLRETTRSSSDDARVENCGVRMCGRFGCGGGVVVVVLADAAGTVVAASMRFWACARAEGVGDGSMSVFLPC